MTDKPEVQAAQNTDRELWRENPDYYSNRIFLTVGGGIGMDVGGYCIVLPIKLWHAAGLKQIQSAAHAPRRSEAPRPQPDWENLYNRIRLDVVSWGGQAHGYLNSLDSKPAKEIAANLNDALQSLIDLELGAGVPPTQDELKAEHWMNLPNEQAWWWHWNGEDLAIPHIYSVMVSKTGKDRYFVAFPDTRWCDEIGGFWLKVQYPNVPSRDEQKALRYSGEAPQPKGER